MAGGQEPGPGRSGHRGLRRRPALQADPRGEGRPSHSGRHQPDQARGPEDLSAWARSWAGAARRRWARLSRSPQKPWVDTARAFREAAAQRPDGTHVPLMFGIDAVHGDNNVVGAVLFPHNIALGGPRSGADPPHRRGHRPGDLSRRLRLGIRPDPAAPRDDRWGRT
ncbi:hypothetical protein ACRAWD_31375 [Caulobacter segnis]